MKNFFSSFFGAVTGVVVSLIICTIIFVGIIVGSLSQIMSSEKDKAYKVKPRSVLTIDFKSGITERKNENPLANLKLSKLGEDPAMGLEEIIRNIKKAKNDAEIRGLYLSFCSIPAGWATAEEIRNALLDFKTSGKFIYAYSEMYDQKAYYVATVADKLFLNPQGGMEFKGLSAQLMFFKKMLDNLNVEVQIFRHGKFKSAIEPFMLDKMSEANRLQTEAFMGSIWMNMIQGVATQRKLNISDLNAIADNLKVGDAQSALELKLVDGLKYEDEVQILLKEKTGTAEKDKQQFVKLADYTRSPENKKEKDATIKKDKIAVIYAVGEIRSGEGEEGSVMGSASIVEAIRDARLDEQVKAIVLRVNSPGGSALASEVIWREVSLAKKAKPFIVSMGDVAASGGYYISCAADKIYAQPNTITGSIGVFGILPNAQKLFSEKFGITMDTVNTNKHADLGSLLRPVTSEEREFIQQSVEDIYKVFTGRVAGGRKMEQAQVDSIGQGRVWSGTDALKIKLVDELGGLDKAIAYAASKANTSVYRIISLPKQKNPLEAFFNNKVEEAQSKVMKDNLGEQYTYLQHLRSLMNMKGVQARLPFSIVVY